MELGHITGDSPYFAFVLALFIPSFLGILFVIVSKDATRKRLVLPATLVTFHACVFLIIYADGRFGRSPAVLAAIVAALAANAGYVAYALRYCVECGATTARIESEPWRCAGCRTRMP